MGDNRGGEAIARNNRTEDLVQPSHGGGRIASRAVAGDDAMLELLLDHGHHHGGGESLPGDVAESEPESVFVAMREVEIAGEGAGRQRHRLNVEPLGFDARRLEQRDLVLSAWCSVY